MEILLLIFIPLAAGAFIQLFGSIPPRLYRLILALSGAFVLGMCFMHLLPETYLSLNTINKNGSLLTGVFIVIGMAIQIVLEWLTGGIEHGHVHSHEHEKSEEKPKIPYGLIIGLCLHALIEGLPLSSSHHHDHHFLTSVLIHKLPVAMVLVMVLRSLKLSNATVWLSLVLFTLMAPLGMFLTSELEMFIKESEQVMLLISALVIGVLLHIGTTILFESNESHSFNTSKLLMIFSGFLLALFTSL